MLCLFRIVFFGVLANCQTAFAHGFGGSGWLHPLTGPDHMLAMIAVGAWSAQLGGRAIYWVPAAFFCAMAVGGILGLEQITVPGIETGIALSVLLLGLAIALECKSGIVVAVIGAAIFGICHGWVHGYAMPPQESRLTYFAGFLLTTAGLHIAGATGSLLLIDEARGRTYLRLGGSLAAIAGLFLLCKSTSLC